MLLSEETKGLLVDTDESWAQSKLKKAVSFELKSTTSIEEAQKAVSQGFVDFVILHEPRNFHGLELVKAFRKHAPPVPMILLCATSSGTWAEAIREPELELVNSTVSATELTYRISKLLSRYPSRPREARTRVFIEPVRNLRSSQSGRLDAERIAQTFGLSLKDIAKAIGKPYTTIHKTADSVAVQELLLPFERVASAINKITEGKLEPALKIWLNAPNKALPNHLPIDLIKEGRINVLADLLEDVLLGHPD